VCDTAHDECVDCLTTADCYPSTTCGYSSCHITCGSDKDCTPNGQLCDTALGGCVDCLQDADCGPTAHCNSGRCIGDACTPLAAICLGTDLLTCDEHGTSYALLTCPGGCSESGGAHCGSTGTAGAGGNAGAGASGAGGGGTAGAGGAGAGGAGAGGAGAGGTGGACNADMVTISDCCMTPATTAKSYSGIITVTASGIVYGSPTAISDPFYYNFDTTPTQCVSCLTYNRASEGACPCPTECPTTTHFLSDLLVGGYPAYNPSHSYTVQIDLGTSAAQPLHIGYGDGGCFDNSGSFNLSIACP
jgi:hypothetical protein